MNFSFENCRVRIPPSPTGKLHLGTARTALYNFLLAKKYDGSLVLRLEDTDIERSKSEYATDIIEGLKWLGVSWDEGPLRQREHIARHKMVVTEMLDSGKAYECFCTQEELEEIKQQQRLLKKGEGYNNKHRNLTEQERQAFRDSGRKPAIRFKLPDDEEIFWHDLVKGEMKVNTGDLGGDPVIVKATGEVLYNFAVVVDDHDEKISHIIRGEDHLHNTAKQIALYKILGWKVPEFGHTPLIFTENHEKLSKRKHGDIADVSMYREIGYLPETIVNYLIAMSWNFPAENNNIEIFSLAEAVEKFEITDISKSPAVYDRKKLDWFSKEYFKKLSSKEVLERARDFLKNLDLNLYPEEKLLEIISLVKDGLTKLSDLPKEIEFFFDNFIIPEESYSQLDEFEPAEKVLKSLKELLEKPEINFESLLEDLSRETQVKKSKNLFMPIRIALSGAKHGPDIVSTIKILGKTRVIERINKALKI